MARCRQHPAAARTVDAYELCTRRVDGELGQVPLAKLGPQLIQRAYDRLLSGGLSVRTVFQTHAVLHRALKQAQQWGLLGVDPTGLVAAPRPQSREMTALSTAQLSRLLASARDSRWYPVWVLLGTAGLRIGEALGLRWSDVDLDQGCLQIRRALQRQRGRGLVFVEPKTRRSRRLVCLSGLAVEALREHRGRSSDELVFVNRDSQPQESSSVTSALRVALDRAGLPQIRVHDLRHTTATVLLEAGTHPKMVQELLGHSTVALTLNTYSPSPQGSAAKRRGRWIGCFGRRRAETRMLHRSLTTEATWAGGRPSVAGDGWERRTGAPA